MTRSHVVARFQIAMCQQGDITPDKWGKTGSKIPMFEMQHVRHSEEYTFTRRSAFWRILRLEMEGIEGRVETSPYENNFYQLKDMHKFIRK